tara:strand:- start:532 stop:2808 length:2277 start_codon:yes stop_codon:yes gene_type:complete
MSFTNSYSEFIWGKKYKAEFDKSIEDTWRRVAHTLASGKKEESEFYSLLEDFKFLPAGRILTSIGSGRKATAFNCFVMDTIDDSMPDIFRVLKESALTQKMGGGVGYDFSTLRPSGESVETLGTGASGPVSFMSIFDTTTKTIIGGGNRRGAQMGVMNVSHPDIEKFILAKRGTENNALTQFNISVTAPDAFMEKYRTGREWHHTWNGKSVKKNNASDLMEMITKNAYDYAEPGLIFIDRINAMNNLHYCESIASTNPCGEQPLPPYGACLLGSFNLTQYLTGYDAEGLYFDLEKFKEDIPKAVRLLDKVIDKTEYPLEAQRQEATNKRRMGIGITGFASVMGILDIKYGSYECMQFIEAMMTTLRDEAYRASTELSTAVGSFPLFDKKQYLKSKFIKTLPRDIRDRIEKYGIRNSHLLSIAPTGTISLLANCVSHSIEPEFEVKYKRNTVIDADGNTEPFDIETYAYAKLKEMGKTPKLEIASDVHPKTHIDVQAKFQEFVDSSISKTINVSEDYPYEDFKDLYGYAYNKGCKGITLFRPNENMNSVIDTGKSDQKKESQEITSQRRTRPANLYGSTYRIPYKNNKGKLYITINRDPEREDYPFEVLISHGDTGEAEVWLKALARMLSAIMTRTEDIQFVIESFEKLRDSEGGFWGKKIDDLEKLKPTENEQRPYFYENSEDSTGVYIHSGPHAIALALRMFLSQYGHNGETKPQDFDQKEKQYNTQGIICPQCQQPTLIKQSGCSECQSCEYSSCN